MARVTTVNLIDDLSGGTADESVEFGIGGTTYEIDLSSTNAAKLRTVLAPYIEKARKAGRLTLSASSRRPATGSKMSDNRSAADKAADKERNGLIRTWAAEQGVKVAERGRINADVIAAYDAMNTPEGDRLLAALRGEGGDSDGLGTGSTTPEEQAPTRTAADMSDVEVIAWAESEGRKIKRNSKGDVTPATLKGLRADYDTATA